MAQADVSFPAKTPEADMQLSPDQMSVVPLMAKAIATAEGFFVSGSRPQRNHNPGDFEYDIIGKGTGRDGPYVVYPDDATGWQALEKQVELMFSGSHIYKPSMTIVQIAQHWTATDPFDWAQNVATVLGVTPTTRLSDIHAASGGGPDEKKS